MPCEGEEFLCTDGKYMWLDQIVCDENHGNGQYSWYLDSGNDINGAYWKPKLPMPKKREAET